MYVILQVDAVLVLCVQEFISYGLCNIAGAFFSSFNSASCFSRTLVQVSAGGKTQVCVDVYCCVADSELYCFLSHGVSLLKSKFD